VHVIAKIAGRGEGLHAAGPKAWKLGVRRAAVLSQMPLGRCQLSCGIDATHSQTFALDTFGHIGI